MVIRIDIGNRVQLRKQHPCGSDEWVIERVGADIGLRCAGCERRVLLPRADFFKRLKKIISVRIEDGEEGK
ncbi:MAG: DUF951 domain-containing protein [Chloroflexota bacterium]